VLAVSTGDCGSPRVDANSTGHLKIKDVKNKKVFYI
jgi:hypothetical protein